MRETLPVKNASAGLSGGKPERLGTADAHALIVMRKIDRRRNPKCFRFKRRVLDFVGIDDIRLPISQSR